MIRPAAGLLGCAAAILFIVSRRRCIQILGFGTDALAASLFMFLAAMGTGRLLFQLWEKPFKHPRIFAPCTILAVMATTVIGQRLAPVLNLLAAGIAPLRSSQAFNTLTCAFVSAALEFLPAMGIGALLSWLAHCAQAEAGKTKRTAWNVYLAGAVGALIGLLVTSRWLMPGWGTLPATAIVISLLIVFLGLITFRQTQRQLAAVTYLLFAGFAMYGLGTGLGSGYFYGQAPSGLAYRESKFFRVGISADVRVLQTGNERTLQINGIPVASSGPDLAGELGLAYFPRLLRPNARRVLISGFGSGATCGVSLLFPETGVVCSEREPAIVSASEFFSDINHQPLRSPFFSLTHEADRAVLKAHTFDLILLGYGDPRLPNAAKSLTKQFYVAAKSALSPGGILAHRLKLDSFSPGDVALITRTILAVFPHCALARISESDYILLASSAALVSSPQAVGLAQSFVDSQSQIRRDLNLSFGTADVASLLVGHLLLNEVGLHRLADRGDGEDTVISDWNLRLESRGCWRWLNDQNNRTLVNRLVTGAANLELFQRNFAKCGCTNRQATVCHQLENLFAADAQFGQALKIIDWGLRLDPEQPDLLADRLILTREEDPKTLEEGIVSIGKKSMDAANRVGVSLWERKRYEQAIVVFKHLSQLYPESATLWCNLAMNYRATGEPKQAEQCFKRALALDPVNDFAKIQIRLSPRITSSE